MAIAFRHLAKGSDGDTKIVGRGLRVYTLHCRYEMGETPEFLADQYDVPVAAVLEALAYAADNPAEMQRSRAENAAAHRELLAELPAQFREEARRTAQADEAAYEDAVARVQRARRGTPLP